MTFPFSEPGVIEFEENVHLVKESVGKAELKVVRANGADGRVSVHYKTKDIDAIGTRDYERERTIDGFSSSSLRFFFLSVRRRFGI